MEHLWRLMCCSQVRGDDDNSLLDSDVGDNPLMMTNSHNNNNNSSASNSRSSSSSSSKNSFEAVSEANEAATQHILDTLGQLSDSSAPSIQSSLTTCLGFIPSHLVRLYIISHLLDTLPKATSKLDTLKTLARTLDDKQRTELTSIITGLPPSVFGDSLAREATRVLVDLLVDTKESMVIDKQRIASQRKFVDSTIEMFQQTLSSIHVGQHENIIMGILSEQIPPLKMKLILKQLVLSRLLQPDYASRNDFMQQLLS